MQNTFSTRGNALLYVLIAVGLFAALSFTLTKNWGQSTNRVSEDQSRLIASELIQYGNGLRTVIDRLILMDSVSDTNSAGNGILFSATGADAEYGTAGDQPTTELFHTSGGKASYQTPPADACLSAPCVYEFSGQYTVTGVGSDSNPELVMLVVNLSSAVCQYVNTLTNTGWSSVPADDALTLERFAGTNYGGGDAITMTGGGSEFVGKRIFCYRESTGSQRYIYVHVVRAR